MRSKQIVKRLAAAIVAGAAMFAPLGAWADTWTDEDGHVWTYSIGGETATISDVTGAEYDMEIPATLGGKPVVAFGTIFQSNTKISDIIIPDSVTAIAANAFSGCSQLQRVTVGANVASVGDYAFSNCSLLQRIELPVATTTLGTGAFAYCVKLNTAKILGVTSIPGTTYDSEPGNRYYFDGYGAFFGCDKLRTLQLGSDLTYIGRGAFYDCNELYDLVIPDSVTTIDRYAFAECDKLHSVILGSGVEKVASYAFYNDVQLETLTFSGTAVRTLGTGAFQNCTNLQSLELPDGLTTIYANCFCNCDSIPSLVIPDSVTICTNGAFAYCDGLKTVKVGLGLTHIAGTIHDSSPGNRYYFDGEGVFFNCTSLTNVSLNSTLRSIGRGAFYGCSALPEIVIPDSVRTIDRYAFAACDLLKDITIGDGVRLIGECAFMGDSKLENLHLGEKVQTIQSQAFDGCKALKTFTVPETVQTIGDYAFRSCNSITMLTLPDRVGVIGAGAFAYCTGLTTVVIGNGLEEITGTPHDSEPGNRYYFDGYGAFYGCTALRDVTIGASVATIGRGAFYGCTALPAITIPSCVSTIGRYAFSACTALTTLDIQDGGVTLIDNYAFSGDTELTTANLGDRLVTIGVRAFQDCTKLTGLVLPDSLITLDEWCFINCKSLSHIIIPDKVKDLNAGVFAYCTGIKSVKIGKTIPVISGTTYDSAPGSRYYFDGYGAFYGCTSLTDLDLGTTVSEIGRGAFYGCSSLASVTIPDSVTKIGNYAFAACTSLIKAEIGTGLTMLENNVFTDDAALHYVEFKGDTAPADVGIGVFDNTPTRTTIYVKSGSAGWTGRYQPGLPETWQGKSITYAPPPEGAGNPYDFYVYPSKDTISSTDYYWSLMVTTNRYVYGKTVPKSIAIIREGDPIYLSYAFDEYWRGEAFDVTNRFTLTGAKDDTFNLERSVAAHSTANYWWTTNALPEALQNLEPGEYTLTLQLNGDNRLKETDYSNNTTSITFTVVGTPRYTVTFDLNGASGTAPAERRIYEGNAVGELPEVTAPVGWTFLGWYTAATDGTKATDSTKVTADTTLYAHWSKCDLGFYSDADQEWEQNLFVTSASSGKSHMASFKHGDRIYLKYGFKNIAGDFDVKGFVNRFTLNTGTTFDHDWSSGTLRAGKWGWGGSAWYPAELQNLAPGTYTLTCTLDATGALTETDEDNNVQSITFTVVAEGDPQPTPTNYTVTFNANGGTVSPATRTVTSGAAVGELPTPTYSGYTFDGWFTSANGGTKITSSTKVTANVTYYAHWTQVVMPPPGPIPPKPGDPIQVTIIVIINNLTIETINLTVIYGNVWGTNLPPPKERLGWKFVGWYTGENGTGTRVTATTVVSETTTKLYAYYVKDDEAVVSYYLYDSVAGIVPQTAASVYDGYLYNKSTGALAGTIQVKVGKPNAKTHLASVKATVIGLDGKKKSLKAVEKGKALIQTNSPTTVQLVGGDVCEVTLGSKGMVGEYGNYFIDGALNVFTSKDAADKATAAAVLGKWQGVVNVAWRNADAARSASGPYQTLTVTIANKGKAKVAGTLADGTKVSASSQLLVGDEWFCVPVLEPKKSHLAFVLWLPKNGGSTVVTGLADAIVGKPGTLKSGAEFRMDEVLGDAKYAKYLPEGLTVAQNGTKWVVAGGAKAGKVQLAKDGTVDDAKTGDNPSALKLTYTAKTGTFKGSFKAYSDVNGKPKGVTVNVTGVLVDGVGYGAATIKKVGGVSVTIK